MASEDAALEAVVRPILAGLKTKFGLSDAHCALIAKDIEEIANEPADRRNQIIQQIEKEIAHSVSGGRKEQVDEQPANAAGTALGSLLCCYKLSHPPTPASAAAPLLSCVLLVSCRNTPSTNRLAVAHSAACSRGQWLFHSLARA
jgi:hypothetical protein